MASCFHSQWLVASITPLRKHRNGAAVRSGSGSIFATTRGLKHARSLKLRREVRNGYSLVPAKDWRIYCRDIQGEYENEGGGSPLEPETEAQKLVEKIFESINDRNESQLAALLSDDCCYEDALFDSPIVGKQDVRRFAAWLMDAMGPNVKFEAQVLGFSEDDDDAIAQWTLKWKGKEIPFTEGFNSFVLDKEKHLISKISGTKEALSVKPGEGILKVLKIISTTLDEPRSNMEANRASILKIYSIMKEDDSLAEIVYLVAEAFKLNKDGNSLT